MTLDSTKPNKKTISLADLMKENESVSFVEEKEKSISSLTLSEIHEKKKDNKFYLPVLRLNDKTVWDSKQLKDRKHFTDEVATKTCLSNCNDVAGLQSGCCKLDPNDLEHVLGPIDEDWIERTVKWFNKKTISITRHDLVIDYEEGKILGETFFNDHPVFKKKDTYPILRIQTDGPRFACKFLNINNGKCTIYPIRPQMCKGYYCQYVKTNFLVKLKNGPNSPGEWTAIDLHIERKKLDNEEDPNDPQK